ncbi:cation diffusion facilitator family transporter [Olsenella profusa DSM 13989]|uniref:cation diffusion facilitator family transporter n=1 Tax=Olsenella profusa TaxID=138595 RepID=UPI0027896BDA|nr:cation diffusion facilitator family transporter [Olsenella profusa]MDP9859257.1 cation diffusion facilitator family transporter [Olsenella profusa DSM 13989]
MTGTQGNAVGVTTEKVDGRIIEEGAASRGAQVVRVSVVGIVANLLLATFKATFGLIANSIAIVLDAVNNLSDAASSIITIVGTKLAGRQPDRKHPFGYGRVEYLTTVIIAVIVLWAGITAATESIQRILSPELPDYGAMTLVVVAVAVVAKVVLGLYTRGVGRRINSGSLVASGTDALTDSILSAATLVAALVFVFTGVSLEAWLGLVIAIVIIKAGVDILREVLSKIIGERVDADLTRTVKQTVASVNGVDGAYDLLLEDYGPDTLWGSVHIEVPDELTANQIDELTRTIENKVYRECGVVLHTVGIYARNEGGALATKIRHDVYDIAYANDNVLEVHGFYVDEEAKSIRFDLVVSFDAPDREEVIDKVRGILKRRYPNYTFQVALDSDISTEAQGR